MIEHLPLVASLAHGPMLADDPLQVITNPPAWVQTWLWGSLFGQDQVQGTGWLGDLFSRAFFFSGFDAPVDCTGGGGNCNYFAVSSALRTSGLVVLGLALMFRMCTVLFDPRKQVGVSQWLVSDVLIRGSIAAAAINLSYVTLAYLMHGSIDIGNALFEDIMSIGWPNFAGPQGLQRALTTMLSNIAPLPLLVESAIVLYLTVLLVASRVAMLFAIAVAPLLIPLYAFSGNNSLVLWWLRIVGQGLLVPLVVGPLLAIALAVIITVESTPAGLLGPVFGTVTAVASLWFVGHAIHQLLRYLFPGHSGFLGGFIMMNNRATQVRSMASGAGRSVMNAGRLIRGV